MKLSTKCHPSITNTATKVAAYGGVIRQHRRFAMIAALATLSFGIGLSSRSVFAAQDSPRAIVDRVWQLVNQEYVDGTFNRQDWVAVRRELLSQNYTSKPQAYAAVRKALKSLGDEYTRFLDPKQSEALFNQTSGEISGIGIKMRVNEQTKKLVIMEVIANSPALRAGLQPGDEIVAIAGKLTQGLKIEDASQLIRGKVGTPVDMRINRNGSARDLRLVRAAIEVPSVTYHVNQEGNQRVGFIRLESFSAKTSEQTRRAVQELNKQQLDSLVLDLRGNPGGLLFSSIEIAQMFIDNGPIVKTLDRRGMNINAKANNQALTNLPLAVLIDNQSASASEILAGAIQDNQRGVVIGSQSFGKALVQSVYRLADGSSVAITTAHYYTPKGTDINKRGITPNVKTDMSEAQLRQLATIPKWRGSKSDPTYLRAIAVLADNIAQPPQQPRNQVLLPR